MGSPAPSSAPSQTRHLDAARRRLAHLGGLAAQTRATEERILQAATERLGTVEADLASLRPRVDLDPAAAARFEELTLEKGRLALVISLSREHLA